jgi:HAD superfamily hydrolase (TIGR01509 family)
MVKAIVYDMDGMLFHEPHYFTAELEQRYGIPLEESLFAKDPNYDACKRGEITLDEFLQPYYSKWQQHERFDLSFEQAKKAWFDFTQIDSEIMELAKSLKHAGIINVIATNNVRERTDYLRKKNNLDETFIVIGSPDFGVMKPDAEFFTKLMSRLELNQEDVLYYDDKKSTIIELKKFGFDAVVYKSIDQFKKDLEERKIKY